MPLLYWTVTIVFSISVTAVVSGSQVGTSGLTARTIAPSPMPDCQSPSCLTWSQCLADPSQCFTSHTTVAMKPGEYVLHEYVEVSHIVLLFIYGSRSEVNGSARENRVIINCEYREGGIGFTDVANVSLSGITLVRCGVLGANIGFTDSLFHPIHFALHISKVFNVNLSFLLITNSTQVGLLFINPQGSSGIQDSVITHSNYRLLEKYMQGKVECSVGNWECRGTNMWILFLKPLIKIGLNNFIVERTTISHGVNLLTRPDYSPLAGGAGILVRIDPELVYKVQITITNCYFMNNIDKVASHLYLRIYSSCFVLVEDSNFMYANRKTDDPMELVPMVHPGFEMLLLQISDQMTTTPIDVEVVVNEVHIVENVGGGLVVTFVPQIPQSNIHLRLKQIEVAHNFVVQESVEVQGYVVRFEEYMPAAGNVNISLESVEISSNVYVFQAENPWNQYDFDSTVCALSIRNTEVHFKQTEIFNNNIPAVYSYKSDLHFHGVNEFKNNTGRRCGGAFVLRTDSQMYLHQGTQVYILENTALKYGGGICVDGGSVSEILDVCFYQIVDPDILNNNDTFIYLDGNAAPVTGYEIYAGRVLSCITFTPRWEYGLSTSRAIYSHVFHFGFLNISISSKYQVSSQPLMICFCYPGPELMCNETVVPSISVYPGQTFNISAVGMGVGISPAVVRSVIDAKYTVKTLGLL